MLIMITGMIIGLIKGVKKAIHNYHRMGLTVGVVEVLSRYDERSAIILDATIGIVLAAVFSFLVSCFIAPNFLEVEKVETHEIYALDDASGSDYLFTGYSGEQVLYRYVIQTEKGKHIEERKGKNVYIKEGNYKPEIRIHSKELRKDWYKLFLFNGFNGGGVEYVEFLVPENTVVNDFNIDLN